MARRARNNQVLDALRGFQLGMQIGGAVNGSMMEGDLGTAAQSNTVTESASGDQAIQNFQDNYVPQEGGPATAQEYLLQNPDILQSMSPERKASFDVGGDKYGTKDAAQRRAGDLNTQAQADVYSKYGRPEAAQRLRLQAMQTRGAEQQQADSDELRSVFSVSDALRPRNEPLRSSAATAPDITGASGSPEHKSLDENSAPGQPVAAAQGPATQGAAAQQNYDLNTYLKTMAPRAVQTLLKQGKVAEAKQFNDFVESEEGRSYAKQWIDGVRLHAIGDSAGALSKFEKMYNSQMYSDGHSVKLTPLEDGKQYRIDQISADGQVLGSKSGLTADLANQAAHALSPMTAVQFHAQQQAQRDKEAALLDRQIQVKQIDMQRDEVREDRRDERLAKRLEATGGRGLTLPQQRANAEIDAARETVAGMDPAEIRRKTAKQTNTGRENPDYDPSLARAASQAGRRKIGADDLFDKIQGGQPVEKPVESSAIDRKEVAKRFRSERAMDDYTLGKETPNGVEVLQKGKVIGHYR